MGKKFGIGFLTFQWVITLLLIAGAINWGLVTWIDFNLVEWISFGTGWIAKVIYTLVAISGIVIIPNLIYMTLKK